MSTAVTTASPSVPALPLAVHVGFAGARFLRPGASALEDAEIEREVLVQLTALLADLPARLGLSSQHLFVGVSQMAAGADTLFGKAVEGLGWRHRILLPQLRDDYLRAVSSGGVDDFTPRQRLVAVERLECPAVIEEQVVSAAATRAERFDDANLALLTTCDVLICLVNESLPGRPGGTRTLADRAARHGVPLLYLSLQSEADGRPRIVPEPLKVPFVPPALAPAFAGEPVALAATGHSWPDMQTYGQALKKMASRHASERSRSFGRMAQVIVWSHVTATFLAGTVLARSGDDIVAFVLLPLELALLGWGLWTHHHLHKGAHTEVWALARLCAEIARSALAAGRLLPGLDHLASLNMPADLRPMLRTLVALNLCDAKQARGASTWAVARDDYATNRLEAPGHGQIAYYGRERTKAETRGERARRLFLVWSAMAILATALKLALKLTDKHLHVPHATLEVLGVMAIVLPVVAVGVMSLAAAFDAEGRAHVFHEMEEFLTRQRGRIRQAQGSREAALLVSETETRLLGETLSWFSRRSFTGIA